MAESVPPKYVRQLLFALNLGCAGLVLFNLFELGCFTVLDQQPAFHDYHVRQGILLISEPVLLRWVFPGLLVSALLLLFRTQLVWALVARCALVISLIYLAIQISNWFNPPVFTNK